MGDQKYLSRKKVWRISTLSFVPSFNLRHVTWDTLGDPTSKSFKYSNFGSKQAENAGKISGLVSDRKSSNFGLNLCTLYLHTQPWFSNMVNDSASLHHLTTSQFKPNKYKLSLYGAGLIIFKLYRSKIPLCPLIETIWKQKMFFVFFLFANPLFFINGTNVKSFTQPYSKSKILSKAENFFFKPERNFRKTGWTLKNLLWRNVIFDPGNQGRQNWS